MKLRLLLLLLLYTGRTQQGNNKTNIIQSKMEWLREGDQICEGI